MLSAIKERLDHKDDEGFTLIELMVVVLIIAILLAIAIPTFLGARNTANARAAQSNLRNALTAEQTEWTNTQGFSADSTTMSGIEASLTWTTAWSTGTGVNTSNEVAVFQGDNANIVMLQAMGKDGNCWEIAQINDPNSAANGYAQDGTYYQKAGATCPTLATTLFPTSAALAGSAGSSTAGGWYTTF